MLTNNDGNKQTIKKNSTYKENQRKDTARDK